MSEEKVNCPICKTEFIKDEHSFRKTIDHKYYNCPRCGEYILSDRAEHLFGLGQDQDKMFKISSWIRDNNERGEKNVKIDTKEYKNILASLPNYGVLEKQLILLRNIERKTKHPGEKVFLEAWKDIPLAWAENHDEYKYHLKSLTERNLIDGNFMNIGTTVIITTKGWEYLDKYRSNIEERTQAFVAMSFNPELKSVWKNAIKPAIEEAGYTALRVDMDPHNEKIDAKIMTEIKNSRFIIADFTENKHGVYFEAGFALGLGIPVLWCVKKEDLENLHFDTRQYGHIDWESEEELKEKLYSYICAIIGKRK